MHHAQIHTDGMEHRLDHHHPPPGCGAGSVTSVSAAIARGKRPVPFRTRKLRPTAPMVLHPRECGRVGHRRTPLRLRPPHHPVRGPHPHNHHPKHIGRTSRQGTRPTRAEQDRGTPARLQRPAQEDRGTHPNEAARGAGNDITRHPEHYRRTTGHAATQPGHESVQVPSIVFRRSRSQHGHMADDHHGHHPSQAAERLRCSALQRCIHADSPGVRQRRASMSSTDGRCRGITGTAVRTPSSTSRASAPVPRPTGRSSTTGDDRQGSRRSTFVNTARILVSPGTCLADEGPRSASWFHSGVPPQQNRDPPASCAGT